MSGRGPLVVAGVLGALAIEATAPLAVAAAVAADPQATTASTAAMSASR